MPRGHLSLSQHGWHNKSGDFNFIDAWEPSLERSSCRTQTKPQWSGHEKRMIFAFCDSRRVPQLMFVHLRNYGGKLRRMFKTDYQNLKAYRGNFGQERRRNV